MLLASFPAFLQAFFFLSVKDFLNDSFVKDYDEVYDFERLSEHY